MEKLENQKIVEISNRLVEVEKLSSRCRDLIIGVAIMMTLGFLVLVIIVNYIINQMTNISMC